MNVWLNSYIIDIDQIKLRFLIYMWS